MLFLSIILLALVAHFSAWTEISFKFFMFKISIPSSFLDYTRATCTHSLALMRSRLTRRLLPNCEMVAPLQKIQMISQLIVRLSTSRSRHHPRANLTYIKQGCQPSTAPEANLPAHLTFPLLCILRKPPRCGDSFSRGLQVYNRKYQSSKSK
jgi:hypothetical protein